jgi:hypothetical protein
MSLRKEEVLAALEMSGHQELTWCYMRIPRLFLEAAGWAATRLVFGHRFYSADESAEEFPVHLRRERIDVEALAG